MINLSKSYDFFQPEKCGKTKIHIIGCGSVGATIAENLVRCGVRNLVLWDFDKVEPHNLVNQIYRHKDIGKLKVEALQDILLDIDPDIGDSISIKPEGWQGKNLSGYIFLCVDSIELRRKIVEQHMDNTFIKAVFDVRTLLESAQHFAADWSDTKMKEDLINSMQFSHEEAADETPVSACGVTLGVATTVRIISAIAVNNFINFIKNGKIKKLIIVDAFKFLIDAF